MVDINVKNNIPKVKQEIKGIRNQVPFATKLTLDAMAKSTRENLNKQIKSKIDRPTRYTLRSIRTKNATKAKLTASVFVNEKNGASKTLEHLFSGGVRSGKSLEGALVSLGVLPKGMYIVPGEFAPIDKFGNIRRKFTKDIVAYFKKFKPNGKNAAPLHPGVWVRRFDRAEKKRRKSLGKTGKFEFFVVHKRVEAGGSGRTGGKKRKSPEPVLLFVERPRYRQYFNMKKTANSVIVKELNREFEKNYLQAIRSAKRT